MEIWRFFLRFFPVTDREVILDEAFAINYNISGVSFTDVMEMEPYERRGYMKRLAKQLQNEAAAMKKQKGGSQRKPGIRGRRRRR